MSKNEDSSKPVNLGEVTITIDDAVVHLVGMRFSHKKPSIEGIKLIEVKGKRLGLRWWIFAKFHHPNILGCNYLF